MTMPADWRRAVTTFQAAAGKSGGRALLTAVIGQAVLDLANGDRGAAAYFLSDLYRGHLAHLDLPDDYLPAGVTRADLLELAGISQNVAKCRIFQGLQDETKSSNTIRTNTRPGGGARPAISGANGDGSGGRGRRSQGNGRPVAQQ